MHRASRQIWVLVRRLADVVVVLVLVVLATSVLIHLTPGDPARSILGPKASVEAVAALREQLSLDRPLFEQIMNYFSSIFQGDIGTSLISGVPVTELIRQALPVTTGIILATVTISIVFGVPLGLLSALRRGTLTDRVIGTVSLGVIAVPPFVLALVLIVVFAVVLGWLPSGGWSVAWPESIQYVILPSFALAGYLGPQVMRSTRQAALAILGVQFLEAAEARGLSRGTIVWRHLLPNSALPVVTVIGVDAAVLISGTVVVEALFGMPGLGLLIQEAVASRDYTVLQGASLVTAVAVVAVNFLCEVTYRLIDPRVRTPL